MDPDTKAFSSLPFGHGTNAERKTIKLNGSSVGYSSNDDYSSIHERRINKLNIGICVIHHSSVAYCFGHIW